MLIIVSKDISPEALKILETYGEVTIFETTGITYNAIQNHPDIFLFPINPSLIIAAPNTPESFLKKMLSMGCHIIKGENPVGATYPHTAIYNAVLSPHCLIHNLSLTDKTIIQNCPDIKRININQGYGRCNLVALPDNTFITSDKGIEKKLILENLSVLLVNPENIILNGFPNGFFGGCCGISEKYFFFNGSLNFFKEKKDIELFINNAGLQLVELSPKKPVDIGSIFILE